MVREALEAAESGPTPFKAAAVSTPGLVPPPLPGSPRQRESIPMALPVVVPARTRLQELTGSMVMAALVSLLLCIVWAAVLRTSSLPRMAPHFFLTLACSWAVLVPAKAWGTRVEDSWRRRLALMCLGVGVGTLALWLEGFDLPTLLSPEARAEAPLTIAADPAGLNPQPVDGRATGRHWFESGLLVRGQEVPLAPCYLAYFGLSFFLLRWWKMADRRRPHRFSFWSVFTAALVCWGVMLIVWPNNLSNAAIIDQATAIMAPVMASVVIQLVSPWEAPPPRKSRKLRLADA
jgi:peptidoglycan/LPS O-acetylase OafA/YrhL